MKGYLICFLAAAVIINCPAFSVSAQHDQQSHQGNEMPAHHKQNVPVGVMGDHTHQAGEWMFSYRYMFMEMDGNRDGASGMGRKDVLAEFMVAPEEMTMEMHMLGAMYAPTDDITVMVMVPYIRLSMDHVNRMGVEFTTRAQGIGDIKAACLYVLHRRGMQQVHLNAGISFPTGSIDEKDDTPAGKDSKLPYPMQLGSGAYDFMPGITYVGHGQDLAWGAQAVGTIRSGRNGEGYALGDRLSVTAWCSRDWSESLSASVRLDGRFRENIDGDDDDLNPLIVPTADPDLRSGQRLDFALGLSINGSEGWTKGHRLAIEYAVPVYQYLDGPQLETDWTLIAGWQYLWGAGH